MTLYLIISLAVLTQIALKGSRMLLSLYALDLGADCKRTGTEIEGVQRQQHAAALECDLRQYRQGNNQVEGHAGLQPLDGAA